MNGNFCLVQRAGDGWRRLYEGPSLFALFHTLLNRPNLASDVEIWIWVGDRYEILDSVDIAFQEKQRAGGGMEWLETLLKRP
jgi:hypothetical protein